MPGLSKRDKRLQKRAQTDPKPAPAPKTVPAPKPASAPWTPPAWTKNALNAASSVIRNPISSYVSILALQLRVIWGMWWGRDITMGDTTQYFLEATNWFQHGRNLFLWSPLYTSFYGALMHISSDPYTVTILHRVIIVLVIAALALALMRRLLPPGIAWMAAAWWVVLPINYDALYEVHLFAVIPLLLSILFVIWFPGPRGRGLAVSALLATGILMRNENVLAAGLFALLSLGWEVYRSRGKTLDVRKLAVAYGLPVLGAVILSGFYYLHSAPTALGPMLRAKHTLNVCQIYAYGYLQRASDFQGDPWTQCGQLMTRVFGSADLSITEAFQRNPKAMLEHLWWNIELVPSGLQIILFNFRSGAVNPDYAPTYENSLVLIPSVFVCATLAIGLIFLVRNRDSLRSEWTEARVWAWMAMGCTTLVVVGVMITQRPRPSYMFILGIVLRALTALCFYALIRSQPVLRRVGMGISLALVAVVFIVPSIYQRRPSDLRILVAVRRLAPFGSALKQPNPLLITSQYGAELTSYAALCHCPSMRFDQLRKEVNADTTLAQALDKYGATVFYADENVLIDPDARKFIDNANAYDWQVLAGRHQGAENWAVLKKRSATAPGASLSPH